MKNESYVAVLGETIWQEKQIFLFETLELAKLFEQYVFFTQHRICSIKVLPHSYDEVKYSEYFSGVQYETV